MAKVRQTNTTRFLEAPFVRMLRMRSASLKIKKGKKTKLAKMTTLSKEMRIAQLSSLNEWTLKTINFMHENICQFKTIFLQLLMA